MYIFKPFISKNIGFYYLTPRYIPFHISKFLLLCIFFISAASATETPELIPEETAVIEKTNEQVDFSLEFTSEDGTSAPLSSFSLQNRPTILVPVYFKCPRLCTLTLNHLLETLKKQDLVLGKDYSILTVSFADTEGPELALKKGLAYKKAYFEDQGVLEGKLSMEEINKGWQFLTGSSENITKLMNQVGFQYKKDGGEYSHSSLLVLLNPDRVISHYFYGFPVKGKSLKLALVESSQGIIGSAFEKILLYCFRFDHITGQYTLAVLQLSKIVGFISFFGMGSLLLYLRRY